MWSKHLHEGQWVHAPGYSQPKHRDRISLLEVAKCWFFAHYCCTAVEIDPPVGLTPHDKIIWVEVSLRNKQKLILDCFYRTPSGKSHQELYVLESSLNHIKQFTRNNVRSTIIQGGDFNLDDINCGTDQLQREATREDRVLDLLCTSKPLVKSMATIPWESNHHSIVCDSDIMPVQTKNKPRKIYQYSKANWTDMRRETEDFVKDFIPESVNRPVEDCWTNTN